MNHSAEFPRVVIEQVTPEIDRGRHPIKRSIGGVVDVGAAIFKDGHDLILAQIVVEGPDGQDAERVPLSYRYEPDRWFGSFRVHAAGRYRYWIEAWPDHFGSFRSDLEKRLAAGQDVRGELLEGARIIEQHARFVDAARRERLLDTASRLKSEERGLQERLGIAFSQELVETLKIPGNPAEVTRLDPALEIIVDVPQASFSSWYELFPRSQTDDPTRSGTFAETARRLPELAELGFDVLYLPPIHPIGVTHRKGRNNSTKAEPGDVGSPWAIGSALGGHTAVNPELGTLEDFRALVRKAGEYGIQIALDFALQCSPDHPWVKEHPEWFFIRPDGSIRYAENPPKKYEDIYPLNFWCDDRAGLWGACRDILLFWIEQGVKIFRVDNPHTKPFAFWEWALAEVTRKHPEVFFLSESFTRPNRMKSLAKLGFNQSYTYFTWKNSAWELKDYFRELTSPELVEYYRPNLFCNTPDILHEYLQTGGRSAFQIRLVLAATLSPIYGIYSGYELCENQPVRRGSEEYLDSEKYQIRVRDWNAPHNIRADIIRLNRIRRENPALQELANLSFFHSEYEGILAYRKSAPGNDLLVIVNLDPHRARDTIVHVPIAELGINENDTYDVTDLLGPGNYVWRGSRNYVRLDPEERVAHVLKVSRRG